MANRPAFICELDKDKLIDTQVGFVDTFNYAVRAIDNLKGGKNCTVDWTIDDHPVINVDIPDNVGEGGGGGGYGKVVEDVTEDTQDNKDGLKIWYTDSTDSFIPFPGSSTSALAVTDVDIVNGKDIYVTYSNGNHNTRYMPNALSSLSRSYNTGYDQLKAGQWSGAPISVDLGIKLSADGGATDYATLFKFMSASDSRVSVIMGGNTVTLGVYYV